MAIEVRYVPMNDEGDHGYAKMMRVIYNEEGAAISYSEAPLNEAKVADPSSIAGYYDCLRNYFASVASYLDLQTDVAPEVSHKMLEISAFCMNYISQNPLVYGGDVND
jgi:hypothetical protein